MSLVTKYTVFYEVSGSHNIDGIYNSEKEAISRADYLFDLGRYNSITVRAESKDLGARIILNKKYEVTGKSAVIRQVSSSYYCQSVNDVFSFDGRITISRIMKNYFDDKVIITTEFLHDLTLLSQLAADSRYVSSVCRRLAVLQAVSCGETQQEREETLRKYAHNIISLAKDENDLVHFYQKLASLGLDKFLDSIDSECSPEQRNRVITYYFAKKLKGLGSWNKKILYVCDIFPTVTTPRSQQVLDEVLAELIDSASAIKMLIGPAPNLLAALESLSAVLDGALSEKNCHTDALMALNNVFESTYLPRVQGVILSRIASSLAGTAPLTKIGEEGEKILFKDFIIRLQRFDGFIGGGSMAEAVTLRTKSLLSNSGIDLTIEEAIDEIQGLLGDNRCIVNYLLDLLSTKTGAKKATLVADRAIDILDLLSSSSDLAKIISIFADSKQGGDGLLKRLTATGIPKNVSKKIIDRLAEKFHSLLDRQKLALNKNSNGPQCNLQTSENARNNSENGQDELVDTIINQLLPELDGNSEIKDISHNRRLNICFLGTESNWRVDAECALVSVGRSPSCDIYVNNGKTSRFHGHFKLREGVFEYHDQSTNGSYVLSNNVVTKVHNASIPLDVCGVLFIGMHPIEVLKSLDAQIALAFRIEAAKAEQYSWETVRDWVLNGSKEKNNGLVPLPSVSVA